MRACILVRLNMQVVNVRSLHLKQWKDDTIAFQSILWILLPVLQGWKEKKKHFPQVKISQHGSFVFVAFSRNFRSLDSFLHLERFLAASVMSSSSWWPGGVLSLREIWRKMPTSSSSVWWPNTAEVSMYLQSYLQASIMASAGQKTSLSQQNIMLSCLPTSLVFLSCNNDKYSVWQWLRCLFWQTVKGSVWGDVSGNVYVAACYEIITSTLMCNHGRVLCRHLCLTCVFSMQATVTPVSR